MANLNRDMVDLRIRYDEAVTDAKESGKKLVALIERTRKDQEEAQKVKSEHHHRPRSGSRPSLTPSAMSVSMLLASATRLTKSAT
jgi:hypothetical protein